MEIENKLLKVKIKLYEDISNDERMILYHTTNKARTISDNFKELCTSEISNERRKELTGNISSFLIELSQSKFGNMHDFTENYISSRNIRRTILDELNK